MSILLIVSLALVSVLSYFVYRLSQEVKKLNAHITELRYGLDKANVERNDAIDTIKVMKEDVQRAINVVEKNKEKMQNLLRELESHIQKKS